MLQITEKTADDEEKREEEEEKQWRNRKLSASVKHKLVFEISLSILISLFQQM